MIKQDGAYLTIAEVAVQIDENEYVLRFWERKFRQLRPLRRGGNRRYYSPADIQLLVAIKFLLRVQQYTVAGARRFLAEKGVQATLKPS